ncbi:MAG: hypothetical protein GEV03_05405 [Streptosporangiales bacterium]|nr:hypothetical protein [Streptosporangiales bacterium]
MRFLELSTVDGFIAFDMDCPISAGGTRMVPDVTREETGLLARAMTYKFAVLRQRMGGAKAGIRSGEADRETVLTKYCEEIRPMVERGEFLTASDLGTRTQDFLTLESSPSLMHVEGADGVTLDALVTGLGVIVAAEVAAGGLAGRTLAIEGFGKVGGAAAAEAVRRDGRVVAVSTVHGAVVDPSGLDADRLLRLRATYGDGCIEHLGLPVTPASALYEAEADVLVPGARAGVLDARRAAAVRARLVAPAANVPYTAAGLDALRGRGIVALADFVCNAGATMGYVAEREGRVRSVDDVRAAVEDVVEELTDTSMRHPEDPYAGACTVAEEFLRTWRPADGMPDGAPLARD